MVAADGLCKCELFVVLVKREGIVRIEGKAFKPANSEFTSH